MFIELIRTHNRLDALIIKVPNDISLKCLNEYLGEEDFKIPYYLKVSDHLLDNAYESLEEFEKLVKNNNLIGFFTYPVLIDSKIEKVFSVIQGYQKALVLRKFSPVAVFDRTVLEYVNFIEINCTQLGDSLSDQVVFELERSTVRYFLHKDISTTDKELEKWLIKKLIEDNAALIDHGFPVIKKAKYFNSTIAYLVSFLKGLLIGSDIESLQLNFQTYPELEQVLNKRIPLLFMKDATDEKLWISLGYEKLIRIICLLIIERLEKEPELIGIAKSTRIFAIFAELIAEQLNYTVDQLFFAKAFLFFIKPLFEEFGFFNLDNILNVSEEESDLLSKLKNCEKNENFFYENLDAVNLKNIEFSFHLMLLAVKRGWFGHGWDELLTSPLE